MIIKRICVYCASSMGTNPNFAKIAKELGHLLAEKNIELVYGGANVGIMGILADAVMEKGGKVIGVMPQKLVDIEKAHKNLPDLRIVNDMHERKATMATLADAFIALPGGFGTLEELFEVLTWAQIGYHQKPIAIIDVDGFYSHLQKFVEHATAVGLVKPETAKGFELSFSAQEALAKLLKET